MQHHINHAPKRAEHTPLEPPAGHILALSLDSPGNFSLTGIAWAILSGAANATQSASSISKLDALRFGPGYKTTSSDAETPDYQLAPNPTGFLLEALFQAHHKYGTDSADAISHLLNGLWGAMVTNDAYASGASWEYVKPDETPGIDAFTSLAHPWGAAPTYVLPEYLLGVHTLAPGYTRFVVQPAVGYLGLEKVEGRVPTPFGGIKVRWSIQGSGAYLDVEVPRGTKGELRVPEGWNVRGKGAERGVVELLEGQVQVVLQAVRAAYLTA